MVCAGRNWTATKPLRGFRAMIWMANSAGKNPQAIFLPAIEALLPKGYRTGEDAGWFTFSCKDAGAGARSGVLAFDVGFSAGKPEADGFVRRDDALDFTARLYLSPKTGKVLDAALVENRASRLKLEPNPKTAALRRRRA